MNRNIPNEVMLHIMSFRPTHPVALLIQNKWREIVAEAEECLPHFCYTDEELEEKKNCGFYTLIVAFDGDIDLVSGKWDFCGRNFKTRLLYGTMDAEEYNCLYPEEEEYLIWVVGVFRAKTIKNNQEAYLLSFQ